jgi:hypothetical protein
MREQRKSDVDAGVVLVLFVELVELVELQALVVPLASLTRRNCGPSARARRSKVRALVAASSRKTASPFL